MKLFHVNLHGIKARFLIIGSGLFVLIFIVVGLFALSIESKNIQQRSNDSVKAFAELSNKPIVESYQLYFNSGYLKFSEIYDSISKLNSYISRVQIISVNGDVVFDSQYFSSDKYLAPETQEKVTDNAIVEPTPSYSYTEGRNPQLTQIIYPYFNDWQNHPFTVRYFANYYSSEQEMSNLVSFVVAAMLVLVLVSVFLLSYATNRSLINPLNDVIVTARFISQGNYSKRTKYRSRDEIGVLANSVNQMAKNLEQDIIDLKELDKLKDEFVDIAAYNLKVPINHINFDVKYLISKLDNNTDKKNIELLRDVQNSSNKLQILSEDLIGVTSIKKGKFQKDIFMPVNLTDVWDEIVLETKGLLGAKKIDLKLEIPKNAQILGDYLKIKQLFLSILDNAVKFTVKQNTQIVVKTIEKDASYVTEISDQGVGITKDELPMLFKKFYRAPSSASYNKEGAGLGLYLAKLITEVHHGNIWAESEVGKGTSFFISFLKEDIFKKKYT